MASGGQLRGLIALGDALKGDAKEAVHQLHAAGLQTVLLTGDHERTARAIAIGAGTDIAIESADVVILTDRLTALPDAYHISRRGYRTMRQNVTLAFLFNNVGIPLAATGLIYPVWAMVAMAASVTTIFLNSLWGRGALFFEAVESVGSPTGEKRPELT